MSEPRVSDGLECSPDHSRADEQAIPSKVAILNLGARPGSYLQLALADLAGAAICVGGRFNGRGCVGQKSLCPN